jgi:hypothetical protein
MATISKGLDRQDRALTHDDFSADLLSQILLELRKITAHLALLTDEEIKNEDVTNAN